MTAIDTLFKRYPALTYFVLTFVISFGGFALVGGSGFFSGTDWQTDPRFMPAVTAMLAGPPVAGLLLTGLALGMAGYRDLLARLVKWRLGVGWYAIALLTAPLVVASILLSLSITSPVYLPSVFTKADKVGLIVSGITIGLVGGLVEELGWTGFAIPRLRQRHGIFATGLVVGILWGLWHLLQMIWVGRTSAEALPLAFFLPLYFFTSIAQLAAYRVLMVWVYDRTGSLLVATLMHASYIFSTLFVLAPPTTGTPYLIFSGIFTVVLWVVAAAAAVSTGQPRTSVDSPQLTPR